jgi:histidinol dehydrogenase
LNVLDFVKISSVIGLDKDTSLSLCKIALEMAELEKLTAHASAARARMEGI